jgi:hypothetical protein
MTLLAVLPKETSNITVIDFMKQKNQEASMTRCIICRPPKDEEERKKHLYSQFCMACMNNGKLKEWTELTGAREDKRFTEKTHATSDVQCQCCCVQ